MPTKDAAGSIPAIAPTPADLGFGDGSMAEAMTPLLAPIWEAEIQEFAPIVGLNLSVWNVFNPRIVAAIRRQAAEFCSSVTGTIAEAVQEALARVRSMLAGRPTALLQAIRDLFNTMTTSRARLIAETEASRAVHEAEVILGEESGMVRGWRWLLDGDPCPLCRTIARRSPVMLDGVPFAIIGNGPYSVIYHPPVHPNCRCSLEPIYYTDEQPDWGRTLVDPQPDDEDYPAGEAPDDL